MTIRFLSLVLCLLVVQAGSGSSDPWTARDTIQTDELLKLLTAKATDCPGSTENCRPPQVLMVGPGLLYNGAHISGAVYAGPAGKPEGIDVLTKAAAPFDKTRPIVIYCGCCPMEKCPNIRPAFAKLKELGYTRVKVLIIPTNLHEDWTAKGYPVEKGTVPN